MPFLLYMLFKYGICFSFFQIIFFLLKFQFTGGCDILRLGFCMILNMMIIWNRPSKIWLWIMVNLLMLFAKMKIIELFAMLPSFWLFGRSINYYLVYLNLWNHIYVCMLTVRIIFSFFSSFLFFLKNFFSLLLLQ